MQSEARLENNLTSESAHLASTELDDVIKCKGLKVENLQPELAQVKQKVVSDLEKERPEYERQMQHQAPVCSEAPETNPYNTSFAVRWAATA